MDDSIKLMIDSFGVGLRNYTERLGPENARLKEFKATYDSLVRLAESSSDMMDFYAKAEKPLAAINSQFAALTKETPVSGARTVPSAREAALGYHLAFKAIENREGLARTKEVYRRVFQIESESRHALEFVTRLAEENLFARMSAVQLEEEMESVAKAGGGTAQPHVVEYGKAMSTLMASAVTPAIAEFESERMSIYHSYNSTFDSQYLAISHRLLGAISDWEMTKTEKHRNIAEHVARFTALFYGVDFDAAMSLPRNDLFLRQKVYAVLDHAALAQKGIRSYEDWLNHHRKLLLEGILKDKPPVVVDGKQAQCVHFGRTIPLTQIPSDYARFP